MNTPHMCIGQGDGTHRFLESYKLLKHTQEEIEKLSSPVSTKETDLVVKNLRNVSGWFHWQILFSSTMNVNGAHGTWEAQSSWISHIEKCGPSCP